jgi:hypothetical protein
MIQDENRRAIASIHTEKDVLAGLVFMVIAAAAYYLTSDLSHGTALMIGSGVMPHLVCALLFLFGAAVFIGGLKKARNGEGATVEITSLRPLFVVVLCIAVFAGTLEWIGLVPAVLLVVALSPLAGHKVRPLLLALVGIGLAALCVAIFIWGAKLPISAGPF